MSALPKEFDNIWNGLLSNLSGDVGSSDISISYAWVESLIETSKIADDSEAIVISDNYSVRAIVPIYHQTHGRFMQSRSISLTTELYSGRPNLLISPPEEDVFDPLLHYLQTEKSDWDIFFISIVDGARTFPLIEAIRKSKHFNIARYSESTSPYLRLDGNWAKLAAALPKKLRWTIKKSEKNLESIGSIEYVHYCKSSEVATFLAAMMTIEGNSWKDDADSSLTKRSQQFQFYESFLHKAANIGWFSGHILYVDRRPIAHVCGTILNNTFLDMKESYDNSFRKYSPSHVLKKYVLSTLCELEVTYFDFMGDCEEYKMRWTSLTYVKASYVIFNKTIKGRLLFWKFRILEFLRYHQPENQR